MSYNNPLHQNRLILIPHLRDVFASLHVYKAPPGSVSLGLNGDDSGLVFQLDEVGGGHDRELFNFPILFHANGEPWHEANDYLLSLMRDKSPLNRRTDDARRRASKLLDYLLFCEDEGLDWKDFSGARPPHRPTYKYFYHLINDGHRSNQVINQYTYAVYHFYTYVSEHWHDLDMKRVDTIEQVRIVFQGFKGTKILNTEKRSQTRRTARLVQYR